MLLLGEGEQQASLSGEEERQEGHLDEPGCKLTGLQSCLRSSGRAEKQPHQGPSFDLRPKPQSKAAAWLLSRRRVVGH